MPGEGFLRVFKGYSSLKGSVSALLWLRLAGVRDAGDMLDALRDAGVIIVPGEGLGFGRCRVFEQLGCRSWRACSTRASFQTR